MQARSVVTASVVVLLLTGGCASEAPDATRGSPAAEPPTGVPTSPEDGVERPRARPAPDAAPNFTLTDFQGARFELYDHLGKPIVVNFWDSW